MQGCPLTVTVQPSCLPLPLAVQVVGVAYLVGLGDCDGDGHAPWRLSSGSPTEWGIDTYAIELVRRYRSGASVKWKALNMS